MNSKLAPTNKSAVLSCQVADVVQCLVEFADDRAGLTTVVIAVFEDQQLFVVG